MMLNKYLEIENRRSTFHTPSASALGFRVKGLAFVWGFGFRVSGFGYRVQCFGFRVQGLGFGA